MYSVSLIEGASVLIKLLVRRLTARQGSKSISNLLEHSNNMDHSRSTHPTNANSHPVKLGEFDRIS
jgi:hypothetical protein